MKLTQMIVQGLQESKSPLLQLPHFEEEHLRYCVSKKYKVRSLQDLVSLKDSDRRNMLRFLGEEKYDEVFAVLGSFPHITMDTKLQVLDDEDSNNITAGSIVTVTVTLTRKRMSEVFEKEQDSSTPCLTEEAATTEEAAKW
nr:translocation protein SEC63 homolog [Pseudochaenichthys georgianus]